MYLSSQPNKRTLSLLKPKIAVGLIKRKNIYCLYEIFSATSYITPSAHFPYPGRWGELRECPFGEHVIGVQLRIQPDQGEGRDDTALNAIRLRCTGGKILKSRENPWGDWGEWKLITAPDYFMGVQLRQEKQQTNWDNTKQNWDNTGATGLRMMTNNMAQIYPGEGQWGDWSQWLWCPTQFKITGFKTKVATPKSYQDFDNLSLTEVKFVCRGMHQVKPV